MEVALEAEKKEKDEAHGHVLEYMGKIFDAQQAQKDAETHAKYAEDIIKSEIEPTLVHFYAIVIKFVNLWWLDEVYLRALVIAWKEMVSLEKEHSGTVNEDELKVDLLDNFYLDARVIGKIMLYS